MKATSGKIRKNYHEKTGMSTFFWEQSRVAEGSSILAKIQRNGVSKVTYGFLLIQERWVWLSAYFCDPTPLYFPNRPLSTRLLGVFCTPSGGQGGSNFGFSTITSQMTDLRKKCWNKSCRAPKY